MASRYRPVISGKWVAIRKLFNLLVQSLLQLLIAMVINVFMSPVRASVKQKEIVLSKLDGNIRVMILSLS